MKNLYKTLKSWLCVLLAVTMLCADMGMSVFAAEGIEQDIIATAMEETSLEDIPANDTPVEEVPEDEETEEEIDTSEEDANEEDIEEVTEENPVAEDTASGESTDVEDEETLEDVLVEEEITPEEQNDIEDAEKVSETSEDGIIASGEYKANGNDITWVIDADGKLTVEGTGNFERLYDVNIWSYYAAPWYDQRLYIKSAEINVTGMKDASCMFYGCENLTSLNMGNFDTSKVTSMSYMFSGCSSLTSLDLSNFDTRNVTIISSMFKDCSNLRSLDMSSFDTSNVKNMGGMFSGCSSLESLDLSNFDTRNVTIISSMFSGCSTLKSLELSNFDTRNVTGTMGMSSMFSGCSSLESLDLSSFDTSNVTIMDDTFHGCSSLTSLDVSNFDTSKVTSMSYMFSGCNSLESLDVSNFDTSNVTNMDDMFYGCSSLTSLDLSSFDTSNVKSMTNMFYDCSSLTSLDLSNFDTSNVSSMQYMFFYCSNLKSLDVSSFDTSNVHYMDSMFEECRSLESLDVSNFDTSNVWQISYMFSCCSSLKSLDVSNFNNCNITNMGNMFSGCSSLTVLDLDNFGTSNVNRMYDMFSGCSSLTSLDLSSFDASELVGVEGMLSGCTSLTLLRTPLNLDRSVTLPKSETTDIWFSQSGYECKELPRKLNRSIFIKKNEVPFVSAIKAVKTKTDYECGDTINVDDLMVTYYDANNIARELETGEYMTNADEIDMSKGGEKTLIITYGEMTTSVELNVTGSESGGENDITWALDADGNLTVEGTGDFKNASGYNRAPWYHRRLSIKSAEINVTGMTNAAYMFYKCENVKSINLAKFDAGNVTSMGSMFSGCSSLESLELGKFDTSNVTYMSYMFSGCSSLESLDISNFDTSKVSYMSYMFSGCSSLGSLDLSNFDTSNVWDMDGMFSGCGNLGSLDISNFDTRVVGDMDSMFSGCSSLGSLDLSNFDTRVVEDMDSMFSGCSSLGSLDLSNFDISNVWTMSDIFDGCTNLISLHTPYNVKCHAALPKSKTTDPWSDVDGHEYTELPRYMDHSILLVKKKENDIGQIETVAVPAANPESGRQLATGSKVTLTCETAGAEIYYTTSSNQKDLTDPTADSVQYTTPIVIDSEIYIRAVAVKGANRSKFIDLHYTVANIGDQVLKPYASPEQGVVESGTEVELKCDMPDAGIYYVTGGNADMLGAVPVDEDHKYTEPIEITKDMAIKAIAVKDGMENSDFSVFVYRINIALDAPAADPASGTVDRGSYISLNADSNVNIYYTTDQSDPVTSGSAKLYESRIRVDGDPGSAIVIKAAAEKKGTYSEVVTFTYTVSESTVKGLQVMLAGGDEFTYTGSAITPAVIVTNNGEELVKGKDYTVRYSNNIKAANKNADKAPKITVTGKGNLTKSRSVTFTIKPMDIGDEEKVVGRNIVVASGKTASPVLLYNGVKLTAKDFTNPDSNKKYNQDATITITGKGNFEGTRDIDVRVVNKKDRKKFTVVIDNRALKRKPLIYDGEEKTMDGYFEVYDTADKSTPLEEYSDYVVIYPKNNINAGKVKFTVVGLGEYYGTVAKSYTIKPRVVKTKADGNMVVNMNNGDEYPFKSGGVTIPNLKVTCDGDVLVSGKDYKVTYSNNKKICSNNKAKCTISFKGNYKGSRSLVRKFNITAAVMDDADQINGSVSVAAGDRVYTGKPGAYKSVPYVTVNGVLLKSSDYKVSYYKDEAMKQIINGKTASSSVDLTDRDKQTVYMKIQGKGNYKGVLTAKYNVYKLTEGAIDLSKAKVTIVGGNKVTYTGEEVSPDIKIKYKSGTEWKTVSADDIDTYVTVTYINNVNKGKATVMINGSGDRYAGSKTAVFNIVPKSMK